ncbi:predicted protein [Sclerotinia sclerotiorum 1980 UF-70]|uniref:Uncharacterized protein n=1 Tax=Sclerotinia sclerotiorum (strain ATCC 18683 / 1980 / Ss-1) TaxID=665079 RepID=A7F3R8_SCLS1|nr:predicted protein [Sclerotinia sclerotiorum 1980 UF-70]EDN97389.1 predicted protein [Sclerotinia sclerotiorum 1980 UF-70]
MELSILLVMKFTNPPDFIDVDLQYKAKILESKYLCLPTEEKDSYHHFRPTFLPSRKENIDFCYPSDLISSPPMEYIHNPQVLPAVPNPQVYPQLLSTMLSPEFKDAICYKP